MGNFDSGGYEAKRMNIRGVEGLSLEALDRELARGAKLVQYDYCFSFFVYATKNSSDLYFIKSDENAVLKGLSYTVATALFGWWSIVGPFWTVPALINNLRGGRDLTAYYLSQSEISSNT